MPYIGFTRTPFGPKRTEELLLQELEGKRFKIISYKHHWMGDSPFGLLIVETQEGELAIRWSLGENLKLRLEEVSDEELHDFIDDTLKYLSGD